jgi:hypothetical protein
VSGGAIFRDEPEVLRRLLGLLMDRATVSERLFTREQQRAAKCAYFLLDLEKGGAVEPFLIYTLNRLVRHLNRVTGRQAVTCQGRLRGRLLLQATVKAALTQSSGPGRFVCQEVRRRYDVPENQLLKYLVARIRDCLNAVPEVLRAGACYFPAVALRGARPRSIASRLADMEAAVLAFEHNPYLRDVPTPMTIGKEHLARADASRSDGYAEAAYICRRHAAVMAASSPGLEALTSIGRRMLLLPGRVDGEGDPWLKVGAELLRF